MVDALDAIQGRANTSVGYFGPVAAMRSQQDVPKLVAALRAVEAVLADWESIIPTAVAEARYAISEALK